jgi:hypothetical protein
MCLFDSYSVDLAKNSVDVCEQRYQERKRYCGYQGDFFPMDCTKVCL